MLRGYPRFSRLTYLEDPNEALAGGDDIGLRSLHVYKQGIP